MNRPFPYPRRIATGIAPPRGPFNEESMRPSRFMSPDYYIRDEEPPEERPRGPFTEAPEVPEEKGLRHAVVVRGFRKSPVLTKTLKQNLNRVSNELWNSSIGAGFDVLHNFDPESGLDAEYPIRLEFYPEVFTDEQILELSTAVRAYTKIKQRLMSPEEIFDLRHKVIGVSSISDFPRSYFNF